MKTKLVQRIKVALLGLACACAAGFAIPAHAQITGTNQIAFNDFDAGGHSWSYGFGYQWGWDTTILGPIPSHADYYQIDQDYADPLLDPTNGPVVCRFAFSNMLWSVVIPGGGNGWGEGLNMNWTGIPTDFTSTVLSDYIVSFDARVEGLLPDQTTAAGRLEFRLQAPPPAPNGYALYKNLNFAPGSNWTHFVFTLDEGGFDQGTSAASFAEGVTNGITSVLAQYVMNEPDKQMGFDDNNVLLVDNIKLQVIQYAGPVVVPPKTGVAILDYNFDDKPLWYGGGGYAWTATPPYQPSSVYNIANPTYGVGGSNAWTIVMDNSILAPPNTPAWAGTGMNGGGPGDYTPFNTSDRKSYQITFDARIEGMAPDKTTIYGIEHAVHLRTPDDTLLPADGNGDPDELVRLNFVFNVQSNWTTFTFTLNQGAVGGGSLANFDNHFSQLSEIAVEWGIPNANSSDWEFDANNAVIIDNYKIERVYTATPPLSVQKVGNNVVVTWAQPNTGTAKLQSSTTVNGTYADVVGATSPYSTLIASGPKYYRTKWIAP